MAKTDVHSHHRPQELAVFVIPADTRRQMGVRVIRNQLGPMQRIVGGYLTPVPRILSCAPDLRCGCHVLIMVNEEADMEGREFLSNPRATELFMGNYPLKGDAFLIGEGPVETEGFPENDFLSLPQEFNRWKGPGHKVPKPPKVLR